MSQSNAHDAASGGTTESSGMMSAARQEAAGVASTAADEATGVVETAKSEAASVAHEAKDQVRDLYHQTRAELSEQAAVQQRRVADGLRAVGGELGSMARNSEGGVAADLVGQASARVQGLAGWIGDRDPGSLLTEVKSYARAKPGTFIAVAALAGLVVGRLTRALSEGAAESGSGSSTPSSGTSSVGASSGTASLGAPGDASGVPTGAAAGSSVPGGDPSGAAAGGAGPIPTDGSIPGAPDGMSGIDAGTSPWGVTPDDEDTPLYDRTDAATRVSGEEERP
ncbi:MAG: hypothetical protein K0Q52_3377 [Microbacterium sp.]|jgi:ElaB/YqjD/DUF883 family membrane-anchored ribosome-binding protein|nr:hypothetical protein [Microbacterium sp.]